MPVMASTIVHLSTVSAPNFGYGTLAMAEETPKERVDRELIEMLNELRVAIPGVQVLFAFLLTVPFTDRFADISTTDRNVFFAAVITTTLSSAFLIAPTAHHRLRFRATVKEHLVKAATVYAVIGLALLAVAMSAVLFLITDVLYRSSVAAAVAGGFGLLVSLLWFVVPRFYRDDTEV